MKIDGTEITEYLLIGDYPANLESEDCKSKIIKTISNNVELASFGFWTRVKIEIDKNNTTFRWLAEKINVSETTMSGWRKNDVLPRASHALLIASLLDVSLTYLVTGEDSQTPDLRPQEREILKMVKGLSEIGRASCRERV